jgi:hypothetical protein
MLFVVTKQQVVLHQLHLLHMPVKQYNNLHSMLLNYKPLLNNNRLLN